MPLDAIDRVLASWDQRLQRVDATLLALEAEPTYQMLAPRSSTRAPLEGQTAQVVGPALDALTEVFEHRGRLTEVLERAKAVRESMSALTFWGTDDKAREIAALLDGPSIELPPEATPLSRRALLDPAGQEVRVYPEQLLGAMVAAYERARDAVIAVKDAWERAEPELERLERRVGEARVTARSLGVEASAGSELESIERELAGVRVRVARDPLGAAGSVHAALGPRVASVAAGLAGLAAQRVRVEEGLAQCRRAAVELRELHAAAVAAVVRMPLEIADARPPGAPADDAAIEGLGPWLDRIEEAAQAGRWATAEIGLGKWHEAKRAAARHDETLAGALSALLSRRDELAGRLGARRAQAAALAARGALLDAELDELARQAEALLAHRPTPLAKASALVERFEARLEAAARPRGRGPGGP